MKFIKFALKNKDGKYSSDKGLKIEVAKFKRNRAKLEAEEAFGSTAVLLNIIELSQMPEGATYVLFLVFSCCCFFTITFQIVYYAFLFDFQKKIYKRFFRKTEKKNLFCRVFFQIKEKILLKGKVSK